MKERTKQNRIGHPPAESRLKSCLLFSLLFLTFGSLLQANLRAPHQMDGYLSGALRQSGKEGSLTLLGEDIRIVFPDMKIRALYPDDTVSFRVTYEFSSRLLEEVSIPVHFIALDIQDLEVVLNGIPLSHKYDIEDEAKIECLRNLLNHRSSFLPDLYSMFLDRFRKTKGLTGSHNQAPLPLLEDDYLKSLSIREIFDWPVPEEKNNIDFPLAGFWMNIKPGLNSLVITYRQRFYVEERGHGYFRAWPEKGVTGFDYLLYPIRTWSLDEDFKLLISVQIPDFHKRKFGFIARKRPNFRSNISLSGNHEKKAHMTTLTGEFARIPADIFTLLVWVDKDAPIYLK